MKTKIFKKGDKVKYIKEPTKADWESIGEIPIPFKINDILEVYGQNMHSGSIYFKEKGFSYPNICFELYQETYKYEVVHTETQEQWDFVYKKTNSTMSNNWFINKEYTGFCINRSEYCHVTWYRGQNSKIYTFEEWLDKFGHKSEYLKQNQQLDKFPNEGHCKSLDKDLINYLIETRGTTDSKMSNARAEGIGWNYTSFWYLANCSNSNKPKYKLEQLNKFFNKKEEQWIPQVGDYVITKGYSDSYDGRILKITKIDSNRYCYFEVFDKGYYDKNHNFGKKSILRKALPHEIPTQELSKEDLLAEAKRRFPIGCKFRCLDLFKQNNQGGKIHSINFNNFQYYGDTSSYKKALTDGNNGFIYIDGTWAEIVEEPKVKANKIMPEIIDELRYNNWNVLSTTLGSIMYSTDSYKLPHHTSVKNNKILPIKVRNSNITEPTELPKRTRIKIIKKQLLTI